MRIEERIHQKKFRNEYHKLLANIAYHHHWLMVEQQKLLKPFGISFTQWNALSILRGQYPHAASILLIKERMIDQSSDVSRLVSRLLHKKWVTRTTCPKDRRQVDVVITQKGLDLLAQIDPLAEQFENLITHLEEKDAQQVNSIMDKLRK